MMELYRVNGRHPYRIICEWSNPLDNKNIYLKVKIFGLIQKIL